MRSLPGRPEKGATKHDEVVQLTGGPDGRPAQDDIESLVLAACGRILRPVVRLAISLGLKHMQLQRLLTDLLLDEGRRIWRAQGVEPNISQLSVTTGLNRKAITLWVRAPDLEVAQPEPSAAAKTLTLWVRLQEDDVSLARLPECGEGTMLSFEALARRASRSNLHHRAILDELIRLDLVQEADDHVVLKNPNFAPANDLRAMLSGFGANTHDHLAAAVSNVLRSGAPMLERAIYARGLYPDDCKAIENIVRARWATLHHELADSMTLAVETGAGKDKATQRMRVGIYTFVESTLSPAHEDRNEH